MDDEFQDDPASDKPSKTPNRVSTSDEVSREYLLVVTLRGQTHHKSRQSEMEMEECAKIRKQRKDNEHRAEAYDSSRLQTVDLAKDMQRRREYHKLQEFQGDALKGKIVHLREQLHQAGESYWASDFKEKRNELMERILHVRKEAAELERSIDSAQLETEFADDAAELLKNIREENDRLSAQVKAMEAHMRDMREKEQARIQRLKETAGNQAERIYQKSVEGWEQELAVREGTLRKAMEENQQLKEMEEENQRFKQRFDGSIFDPAELSPDFLRDLFKEMDRDVSELQEKNQMLRQELDASRERKQAVEELLGRELKAQNRDEKSKLAEELRAEKERLQALALEEANANIAQAWREWERQLEVLLAKTQSALDAAEDGVTQKLTEQEEEVRSLQRQLDVQRYILSIRDLTKNLGDAKHGLPGITRTRVGFPLKILD